MLTASSILRLPYSSALTLAGIEYAKKSLHYTYNRMGLRPAGRLRKIVAGVAVELAFQHWLQAQGVPYDRLGATAFTEKDKYDLSLGGRRCDLKSFLISDKAKITALRQNPSWLLEASALVPEDQFLSSTLAENDLYLFGFLAGLETRQQADLEKVYAARQPFYLLALADQPHWRGQDTWRSLGRIICKSNHPTPIEVELGGQDAKRAAISERVLLAPRARVVSRQEFFSLLYAHVAIPPTHTIGVRSAVLTETLLFEPPHWLNIWVYGLEIFIAGWLTKAEFRAKSQKLARGTPVKQYPRTQTINRAVLVRELRPIDELAELVKNSGWGRL